ncbi:nucleotide-binding protein [Streptomyces sp. AC1-42W]|nr:nucleotide-binding protein [Streptomyces sp. AC1-42W]PZT79981.1 nucleotide-binding protein [Streptomyces sp. AC1-42T]
MTVPEDAWVFDTGPLRHFAAQGWLGVLRFLAGERPVYIPPTVKRELYNAADQVPAVRQVVEADWIHVHSVDSMAYTAAFSRYYDRLVAGGKNVGECEVLAMGKIYGCEIVLDDAAPRRIADEEGIRVTATVPILCDAIREKKLTTVMVEELADNLLEGDYFLPFGPGGFRQHVLEHSLLDYDEL